ncbi:MAG: hypothetical protein PHE94_06815 [Eubacteriales bacterium]|nr:hypothetical protein [Eubacteriales bacterium]MDD2269306.1 hypothetical protein [Eubacteriales bacterium]MDD3199317.1 hypothetical protein [Eubacteriales bacterium]MDD4122575.1 hypothetical protein [Eubacteriales bacterium]MDD4475902.1 hypothetical protein [Eubacteriales bacterium]
MDYKNVQSATRKGMKDIPQEQDIDFEKEDSEELKKLGRQAED